MRGVPLNKHPPEEFVGDPWGDDCRRIVRALLARHGWRLADAEALADAICRDLAGQPASSEEIERAAIREYCAVLYTACCDQGSERQSQAFEELWDYLLAMALHKLHDDERLAEDLTQQALENTWKSLARCRDKRSFLGYATLILINEIRQHYRKRYKNEGTPDEPAWFEVELSETELSRADPEDKPADSKWFVGDSGDEPLQKVIGDEDRRELLEILEGCVKNSLYRAVLQDLFLDDKTYMEIAQLHDITADHVFVCRNRGLKALRNCEAFLSFMEGRR